MKLKLLPCLALLLSINHSVSAQFLKKLGKKIEQAAERTMERKVEEKSEKETAKAFDSTFNNSGGLFKGKAKVYKPSYAFTHKYVMQMDDGKNKTNINYYLKNGAGYMGTSIDVDNGQEMITVMDMEDETAHIFITMGNQKSVMSVGLDFDEAVSKSVNESEFSITPTGGKKTILGYSCEEYKVKGKDINGIIWLTKNADVSFNNSFYGVKNNKQNASKQTNQSWMAHVDGLLMESIITDTSKRKAQTLTMVCTALDKSAFKIISSDYKGAF